MASPAPSIRHDLRLLSVEDVDIPYEISDSLPPDLEADYSLVEIKVIDKVLVILLNMFLSDNDASLQAKYKNFWEERRIVPCRVNKNTIEFMIHQKWTEDKAGVSTCLLVAQIFGKPKYYSISGNPTLSVFDEESYDTIRRRIEATRPLLTLFEPSSLLLGGEATPFTIYGNHSLRSGFYFLSELLVINKIQILIFQSIRIWSKDPKKLDEYKPHWDTYRMTPCIHDPQKNKYVLLFHETNCPKEVKDSILLLKNRYKKTARHYKMDNGWEFGKVTTREYDHHSARFYNGFNEEEKKDNPQPTPPSKPPDLDLRAHSRSLSVPFPPSSPKPPSGSRPQKH